MQTSLRRHSTFLSLTLLVISGGILLSLGMGRFYDAGIAHADTGSAMIAGSGSATAGSAAVASSGSAAVAATPATTAPAAPDPLANPGDALSTASKLYHSGAWFDLGIFVAFVILFVLYKEDDWFKRGKRAAYFAAVLGLLTILVVPASQGTTPNLQMIVGALATAGAALFPHLFGKQSS